MNKIHTKLVKSSSPFAKATLTAYIIGTASVLATVADIGWLICDMSTEYRPYHPYVLVGLSIALIAMVLSFIYLYRSMHSFFKKKDRAELIDDLEEEALLLEQLEVIGNE